MGGADCGGGDCEEYILRVIAYLDNELAEGDCPDVRSHLEECGPCHEEYDLERHVKALLARKCGEQSPRGLREKVMIRIRQVEARRSGGSVEVSQVDITWTDEG